MQDDILALAKFYLPVQKWRMATVQQVNEKLTFLLLSHVCNTVYTWNLQDNESVLIKFDSQVFVNETFYLSTLAAGLQISQNITPPSGLWCCGSVWCGHKWKPGPLRLQPGKKRTLLLFLFIFGLFFWSVNIAFFFLCWRRQTKITANFDQNISWCDRLVFSRMQLQYKISAVESLKIEPAMISLMENTASAKMAAKIMILSRQKVANYFLFSKSYEWMTSGQNASNS